jgi:recombination protein RecT
MSQQQALTPAPKPAVAIIDCLDTQRWREEMQKTISKELMLDAMFRVARSMVSSNQRLAQCKPQSFFLALLKFARAGLYPDGREGHLIPFKDEVQAIFDWKGLVALASRAGTDVTPKLVFANDDFEVMEDDGTGKTTVIHRVDYRSPRGELSAVYSRAVHANDRVDYEFMTAAECEEVRQQFSRAKDSDAWTKSFGEMCKKTVIRRHSKRWDMSPEIRDAMNADDDAPDFNAPRALPVVEPKLKPKAVDVTSTVTPPELLPKNIQELVASVEAKAAKSKIGIGALMEFIKDICPIQASTLADAAVEAEDTMRMIDDQWDDIAKRIHEAK